MYVYVYIFVWVGGAGPCFTSFHRDSDFLAPHLVYLYTKSYSKPTIEFTGANKQKYYSAEREKVRKHC